MRIGEAVFEQLANVVSFRVADTILPRKKCIFFCHGEMLFKTLLVAKNRDKYASFLSELFAHISSY